MTIGELIKELQECDPDAIALDGNGNEITDIDDNGDEVEIY